MNILSCLLRQSRQIKNSHHDNNERSGGNKRHCGHIASTSAKTLAAAVTAAGLVKTLQGTGPFTVFAPTDAAFASIQKDVDTLLKPENKEKLSKVLTHHVVSGKLMAADLKEGKELTTGQGEKLKVHVKVGKVMIGDAHVTSADIHASNGVIHVIDKVLLPKG